VIAEDSALLRAGIERILTDAGHEVIAGVPDATNLLRLVNEKRPDLAIVDVRMPPTFTDEGLRAAVEARRRHPKLAVLVLSAWVEQSMHGDERALAIADKAAVGGGVRNLGGLNGGKFFAVHMHRRRSPAAIEAEDADESVVRERDKVGQRAADALAMKRRVEGSERAFGANPLRSGSRLRKSGRTCRKLSSQGHRTLQVQQTSCKGLRVASCHEDDCR